MCAREWLEQQAVTGFVTVEDSAVLVQDRRFSSPESHGAVLADVDHAAHVAPFAEMLVGIAGVLPDVVEKRMFN